MQHTKEVIIGVGLAIAIAVIAGAILGGSSIGRAYTESTEFTSIELKKGLTGPALISVTIKNTGNFPVSNVVGELDFYIVTNGTGNPYQWRFLPAEISPGMTTTFVGNVPSSEDMSVGESYLVLARGQTSNGYRVLDTGTVFVTRF